MLLADIRGLLKPNCTCATQALASAASLRALLRHGAPFIPLMLSLFRRGKIGSLTTRTPLIKGVEVHPLN